MVRRFTRATSCDGLSCAVSRETTVIPTPFSWRYERARCGQLWPGGQAALQFKVAELVGCACLSEHSPLMASARNAIRGHGRGGFCGL